MGGRRRIWPEYSSLEGGCDPPGPANCVPCRLWVGNATSDYNLIGECNRCWNGRRRSTADRDGSKIEENLMAANPQARSQPASTVKLLINGQFVESKAKAWRDVVNPATQEVLARVPMCDAAEVGEAVKAPAGACKLGE